MKHHRILAVLACFLVALMGLEGALAGDQAPVAVKIATLHEDSEIWGLDFSPDGKHLAATATIGRKISIWDWRNERIVRTLVKPGAGDGTIAEALRYSPDGRLLAACYGRTEQNDYISIVDAATGEILHQIFDHHYGSCKAIGFTPDGKAFLLVAWRHGSYPGDNLIVYQTDPWQTAWGLRTIPFYPSTLAISSNGKMVAIAGGTGGPNIPRQQQILIVDLEKHAVVRTVEAFPEDNRIEHLAWHPDSVHLVAGGVSQDSYKGPAVKIFDVRSGQQIASETASSSRINALRYTPDGKYLIEANVANTIRIWDGQHRELLQEIRGEAGSLAVSSDGRYLATGGDRKILVWELK